MKKINEIIKNWWRTVDKRFLFWQSVCALAVAYSIWKNI